MSEQEKTKMKIRCPSCSSKLDVTDLKPFTVFPCPQCGYKVTVPMRFQTYVLEEYLESRCQVLTQISSASIPMLMVSFINEQKDEQMLDEMEKMIAQRRKEIEKGK